MNRLNLGPVPSQAQQTTTDRVFDSLHKAIVSFELPPGSKVSEADIASLMDVSRQPVRDAFFRLSKLGFLLVRPQRATLVTRLTEEGVHRAAFIRSALEFACLQDAIKAASQDDIDSLNDILDQQADAVKSKNLKHFHMLDDLFHQTISEIAGRGYAWPIIEEQKAHIDRVRFLSLPSGSQVALDQHRAIMSAIEARDSIRAVALLREHLGRIQTILDEVRKAHPEYFEDSK